MTYKQWCDFRELLNILHIEVESKLGDVKVEEAYDDVWDMIDEIEITQKMTGAIITRLNG